LLAALAGEIHESRAYLARSAAICRELGVPTHVVSLHATVLELIAGDPTRAEREARAAYDDLERLGETGWRSTVAALLALALAAQQLHEEAIHYSEISEELGARRDVVNEVLWRLGRAEALAGRGDPGKAEQLAREAVEIVGKTDDIFYACLSLATLAHLLQAQGRGDEAATVAAQAVDRAERKEAPALVELARSALR
jgi:ATP/maltotriose-dependent transcriptional regulator MalT